MQVVHLIRDGRDVALSYRAAYFGPKHVYSLARRWQRYVAAAEEAHACLGETAFLQVRYEDLTAAPEQELRRICTFLGEEFSAGMLTQYHEDNAVHSEQRNAANLRQPILSSNTGKWRTQMSRRELRIFEALAGDTLERLLSQGAQPAAGLRAGGTLLLLPRAPSAPGLRHAPQSRGTSTRPAETAAPPLSRSGAVAGSQ
jgi:hypothetical protein